nr:hypothetical protein [Tanacetum cinerariifolium]
IKDDDDDKDGDESDDDDDDDEEEISKIDVHDDTERGGDDDEESKNDEESDDEETKEEESLDPIPRTPKDNEDDGNDKEDQVFKDGKDEWLNEEEEADELYRDQESSSVSLQFVTSMLNPTSDVGVESFFATDSSSVASLPTPTTTMTPSIITTITTASHPPIPPTPIPTEVLTMSSHSSRTSYAVATELLEMELKKILIEKMEGNKSIQRSDEQRNLYKALVEAYEADKIILDTYEERVILKRRHDDDDDQGERPSARSDQGSKRQREGKEPESASALLEQEPVQTTSQIEEPSHPMFETGAKDQPIVQSSQHTEWFSQPKKPPTSDRNWNKTLLAAQGSTQSWICQLAKQADSRSSFNELLDTPIDFSNFIMNRLGVDTLTPELLAGPTYELRRGRFYGFAVNRESALDVYSKRRIIAVTDLKIVKWHNYKHLDWILVRRDDDKIYKFKEGDFKRLRLQDIEDMLLLLVKEKLSNLTVKERFAFNVFLRMFTRSIVIQRCVKDLQLGVESYQKRLSLTKPDTYWSDLKHQEVSTGYSNPRGFIYQNKDKKNRLMRIDELHKFSDGMVNAVRNALNDRLKGIRMKYFP